MKLLVKNCSVKRSGAVFGPGSVIELPDADGQRLLDVAPKNFEVITEPKKVAPKAEKVEAAEVEAKPTAKRRRKKADADADALPDVNVEALVK